VADILEINNLKKTKNREEILQVIRNASLPISAEEIYKICLENNSNTNLSTVYRTLNLLEKKGVLVKQLRNDGISYFQENNHNHKHLFICNKCNNHFILDNCPLEKLLEELSEKEGFELLTHSIELYGFCKKCKTKKKKS
jgi:Fur family ferric uptake transcriptional regulator